MSKAWLSGRSVAVSGVYLNAGFSRLGRASHGVGASKEVVSLWPTPAMVCRDDDVWLQIRSNDFIASTASRGTG